MALIRVVSDIVVLSPVLLSCHSRAGGNPAFLSSGSQSSRGRRANSNQGFVQIIPIRVLLFDQAQLPGPVPFLYLLFTGDCGIHIFVLFEADQLMHGIFACKALILIVFVFPYPLDQVAGYPGVQRAVSLTCEDVNTGLLHFSLLDSRLRGNDGREGRVPPPAHAPPADTDPARQRRG